VLKGEKVPKENVPSKIPDHLIDIIRQKRDEGKIKVHAFDSVDAVHHVSKVINNKNDVEGKQLEISDELKEQLSSLPDGSHIFFVDNSLIPSESPLTKPEVLEKVILIPGKLPEQLRTTK